MAGIGASQPRIEVRRSPRRRRTVTAFREQDTIVVVLPQRMTRRDEKVFVPDMVAKVLAREAKVRPPRGDDELARRAAELSEKYLLPFLGQAPVPDDVLWVGNQNQRWGSCTPSTKVIRLSKRMKVMPGWVVDYVLLHELAHLVEASHSAAFWRLLENYPRTGEAKGYLAGFLDGRSAAGGADLG